jgi:hypothetical protein
MTKTSFRLTLVHLASSSQRISLDSVSKRLRFCQMEYFCPRTTPFSLVRHLGTTGVIRIGGNSSDRPSLRRGLTIQRTHVEHLAAFLSATGWQLIYGLNFGSGTAEQAATEAEMVPQIVGPQLLAFQFGNEPDLFRVDIRKPNYNCSDYLAEWGEFLKALRTRVPGAALAGPDIAFDATWLAPFVDAFGTEVVF